MIRISVTTLLVVLCAAVTARGQEAKPDPEAIKKAFAEYAAPGEPHEQMQRLVGKWSVAVKDYHAGPDEPVTSKGTAKFESVLGGRFVRQTMRAQIGGEDFEGLGLSGYDNARDEYVGAWADNMGTGIMRSTGTYDEETHTLTEIGKGSSPFGPTTYKMVSKYEGPDRFVFTLYVLKDGDESRMLELTYTRKE